MSNNRPLRQWALRTVHTVRTVHRSAKVRACVRTVHLARRPQPFPRSQPIAQTPRDVATRANVGRDTANGADLNRPKDSFPADRAGDGGGNSLNIEHTLFCEEKFAWRQK